MRTRGFGGETLGKKTTWKTQAKMEDNIQVDLREVGGEGMDWMELAQDKDRWRALLNAAMNLQVT